MVWPNRQEKNLSLQNPQLVFPQPPHILQLQALEALQGIHLQQKIYKQEEIKQTASHSTYQDIMFP